MSNTVVFIHGNFVTRRCWDGWVARFRARGYECLAIAYPGREGSVGELRAKPDAALLGSLTLDRVLAHHLDIIGALDEKPIVIGHSFGGLLTQLVAQRDVAAAAVAIDSVPPQGVIVPSWSFVRSTFGAINPFLPASRPYQMSLAHWRYAFTNDLGPDEQRKTWETLCVPESRRLSRGGLSRSARIDFKRPHAPLLLIGGELDNIMPAKLNRANYRKYSASPSPVAYREFAGRSHYSVIAGPGWEEVADYALEWALQESPSAVKAPPVQPGAPSSSAPLRLRDERGGAESPRP